jgi:hypothetical protein
VFWREKVGYGTLSRRDQLVNRFRRKKSCLSSTQPAAAQHYRASPGRSGKRKHHAYHSLRSLAVVRARSAGHVGGSFRANRHIHYRRPASAARIRAAACACPRLSLDARLLGLQPGYLWTPGYWGWNGRAFAFNEGYWGPHVGFYGGVNYGFGYGGQGYEGGRWNNGQFEYNRAVNNVNETTIHNTYNTTVINNTTVNRVSYNGGSGGITAAPTAQDRTYAQEKHIAPVSAQAQQVAAARSNPQQRASVNQGKPAVAATPKPGAFSAGVPAKEAGAPYKAEAKTTAAKPPAKTAAAQPAKNAPRPSSPKASTPAARNDVPRPPSTPEKTAAAPKASTPRPAESAAKTESKPQPEKASKPQAAPRTAAASRPENTPRPAAPAARPESSPRAAAQPKPEAAPRAEARPEAPKAEKGAAPEERRQQ